MVALKKHFRLPYGFSPSSTVCNKYRMRNFAAALCGSLTLLLGSANISAGAEIQRENHTVERSIWEQSYVEGFKPLSEGDCTSAERIWLPLAEKGMVLAQSMLEGMIYSGAWCGNVDHKKAAMWSERLANRGDTGAQLGIAKRYADGRGVNKDLVKALMWLNIAEIFGEDMSYFRSLYAKRHKPRQLQIESARKLAILWQKKFDERIGKPLIPSAYGAYISGKITAIHGNDTVELYGQTIRLFGIAVPSVDSKTGAAAKEYLTSYMVGEQASCLIIDGSKPNAKVGECHLGDFGIVELLIKKGLARDCASITGGRYRKFETDESRTLPLPRDCRLEPYATKRTNEKQSTE